MNAIHGEGTITTDPDMLPTETETTRAAYAITTEWTGTETMTVTMKDMIMESIKAGIKTEKLTIIMEETMIMITAETTGITTAAMTTVSEDGNR